MEEWSTLSLVSFLVVSIVLVVMIVVLVRYSARLRSLDERHTSLQEDLESHVAKNDRILKNLVASVNHNDKVASVDNHRLQHYVQDAIRDSNEKMKALNTGIDMVTTATMSNMKTMDDNVRYNISRLYSDTHDLDTKYTHMVMDTAQKLNAGEDRMNRLESSKLDCKDFMAFKNSDFEDHRKNLAESTQDMRTLFMTNNSTNRSSTQ